MAIFRSNTKPAEPNPRPMDCYILNEILEMLRKYIRIYDAIILCVTDPVTGR